MINESLLSKVGWRLLDMDDSRFCLLVTEKAVLYDKTVEHITILKNRLKQCCNCSVSVAVSNKVSGIKRLGDAYKQAELAISNKFYQGEGGVFYFSEVEKTPFNYALCYQRLDLLLEDIRNNEQVGITKKIERLFHGFARTRRAPKIVEAYIRNLELEAIKLVLSMIGDEGEVVKKLAGFNQGFDYETMARLRVGVTEFCQGLAEYIFTTRQAASLDIIEEIKQFVRADFRQEISLKKLAERFYFSPVYLGQLFKETTGMRFSEYLHQIRIDEARRLLQKTNMKIAQIAREIGYCDPDYFVINFKSITQETPSAFRNNLRTDDWG